MQAPLSQKDKDHVSDEEGPASVTRADLLAEKFSNFVKFIVNECFPDVKGLDIFIADLLDGLGIDGLASYIFMGIYRHWPERELTLMEFRMMANMILARASVDENYPKEFRVLAAQMTMDGLGDAHVDKIHRYIKLFISLVAEE